MRLHFADPILHRIPVNEPTIAGFGDDAAETLVVLENVLQQRAGDELIEQLPEGEFQSNTRR